ncbi:methyl-accepting chemotaxis protein [Paenibacillus sp.]|uniref:methyl-accepting chemotaxis protein n=1 Tax=Paenibacillus sp. TaxID=58172 RepID=UPI002D6447D7|nr:methyl-accepting chemotaxis protein [Paenibacillus sp.]HZG54994.1 methyl-accepting chemotaxis protein [Paenibacillus sp.]
MFDWLGWKTGLPLCWSYRLNRHLKHDVEEIFEGIAQTRMQLLKTWAEDYWSHLDKLRDALRAEERSYASALADGAFVERLLAGARKRGPDFSEVFLLDAHGAVKASTYASHVGAVYRDDAVIAPGLGQAKDGKKCLFGPYTDPLTLAIGPSTSSFHDEVTLMFIAPVLERGAYAGAICGRVPNDVVGDLIQRESGHVYPDSGDNYIFMAMPVLQRHIAPGTALSRSRFEDLTFTHGDNLKDGVRTAYGIVSVKRHTELELRFTDPATNELHPGVANTIAKGHNLFVEFPAYPDYRHIPVIGKGVTFQLPHCPDVWGMMCEGDLEEVYRVRGLSWNVKRMHLWFIAGLMALNYGLYWLLTYVPAIPGEAYAVANLLYGLIGAQRIQRRGTDPAIEHLRKINRFIRLNAEGEGDLTQRLNIREFANDEMKELAKWINNMIDSLEGIMIRVKRATGEVKESQVRLDESTASSERSTLRVSEKIDAMIQGIRLQLKDLDVAKDVSRHMSGTLRELEEKASEHIAVAHSEVERIGEKMRNIQEKVEESNRTIRSFLGTTEEIGQLLQTIEEISAQTNLLSLNASIEAARVGEHGRGFAVVAGEIRKLADLTKLSTIKISETLQQIGRKAKEANESMEEGTRVVIEGATMVATASELLSSANADDSLKTQVVDEVVELMEKISAVSIENRKISNEVESTVKDLKLDMSHVRGTSESVDAITRSLLGLVEQFKLTEQRGR